MACHSQKCNHLSRYPDFPSFDTASGLITISIQSSDDLTRSADGLFAFEEVIASRRRMLCVMFHQTHDRPVHDDIESISDEFMGTLWRGSTGYPATT